MNFIPNILFAITLISPAESPLVTRILFVELNPLQPEGKLHVYEVAPETDTIEYVFVDEGQTKFSPLIKFA